MLQAISVREVNETMRPLPPSFSLARSLARAGSIIAYLETVMPVRDIRRSIGSAVKEKSLKPIHESRMPVSSRLVGISRSVVIASINGARS